MKSPKILVERDVGDVTLTDNIVSITLEYSKF